MGTRSSPHMREAMTRFFRAYEAFCQAESVDSLFHLLECMHSTNDRLKSDGHDLISEPEFLALKCLRNFMHHQDELKDRMRVVPTRGLAVSTDLPVMCLIPRGVVEKAIDGVPAKFREKIRQACMETLKWYGNVVNINPAIFNLVVKIAFIVDQANYDLAECEAFGRLWRQIEMEQRHGYSHFVTGDLYSHAGSIDELLSRIMQV